MWMNVLPEESPALHFGSVSTLLGVTSASVIKASTSRTSRANTSVTVTNLSHHFVLSLPGMWKLSPPRWWRESEAGEGAGVTLHRSPVQPFGGSGCTGALSLPFICWFYVDLTKKIFFSKLYFWCHHTSLPNKRLLFPLPDADIDECSLGQYQCSRFARCYNVHGSYKCKCKDGYKGDGLNCVCE